MVGARGIVHYVGHGPRTSMSAALRGVRWRVNTNRELLRCVRFLALYPKQYLHVSYEAKRPKMGVIGLS